MMPIILTVAVGVVLGVAVAAFEQLGIGTQLRDGKKRFAALVIVSPIAIVCGLVTTYTYLSAPLWLLMVLSPLIVALGVTAAIFLVGRSLPDKISNRNE